MDAVETEVINGYTIEIIPDEDCESPREWSNAGEMVCWHRRSNLGDRKPNQDEMNALERGGFSLLSRYLRRFYGATHVLPIYIYEHSGIALTASSVEGTRYPFTDQWDAGIVGFTFDTPETRKETGIEDSHMVECLIGDVETYNQWLNGDIYGFVVTDSEGNDVESCWGFYGIEDAMNEAKAILPSN